MTPAEGLAIARARIAEEARARTGFLDLGNLSLTEWPEELWELGHLEGLNLGSYYHDQNGAFCESEGAGEDNQLRPQGTQWQKLRRLIRLFSHGIPTWDVLTGLEKLTVLQSLNCSNTGVSSLEPLTRLTALQSLDCHGTRISGLEPLAGMTTLKSLNCSWTKANSLEPLADLAALQSLVCIQTKVSSLDPLAGLTALQSIECSYTDVSNLEPLAGLTALESLHCFRCPIAAIPHWLSHEQRPALEELILGNGQANHLVMTGNHRAWRHVIEMRTSVHAEEEIRVIMSDVAQQLKAKFPTIYGDMDKNEQGEWVFDHSKV